MAYIVFFDTEIQPESEKILDIGALCDNGAQFHSQSISSFSEFVKGTSFFCGHNIIAHDLHYVDAQLSASAPNYLAIDTLCLSPLLFPMRPYHKLVKDDKLQSGSLNNPLNDAIKAKQLFDDEISAYRRLPAKLRRIFAPMSCSEKSSATWHWYTPISRVFSPKELERVHLPPKTDFRFCARSSARKRYLIPAAFSSTPLPASLEKSARY